MFGDGTVVIKAAPGHTPGHQILYLKLTKTGGVVLSGDLYHYPEERRLNRLPTFEFNQKQTRATRVTLDGFLRKTGAQLWIQHDFTVNAKLKKAPGYYDRVIKKLVPRGTLPQLSSLPACTARALAVRIAGRHLLRSPCFAFRRHEDRCSTARLLSCS